MTKTQKIGVTYKEFCLAEGSQHIASEFAILKLQELVESFYIINILEVGLGIGAIAGSLLTVNKNIEYTGTEDNEFCLKALKQNLPGNFKRIKLYPGINYLDQIARFDVVIIDGKDFGLQQLNQILSPNGIIAIEGDRKEQQEEMQRIFPNHLYVHCISLKKNKDYSPFPNSHWQGGIKVIFVDPDWKQKMWWVNEKLKTKLKYLFRKLG